MESTASKHNSEIIQNFGHSFLALSHFSSVESFSIVSAFDHSPVPPGIYPLLPEFLAVISMRVSLIGVSWILLDIVQ